MGQISMEIYVPPGSLLSANLHVRYPPNLGHSATDQKGYQVLDFRHQVYIWRGKGSSRGRQVGRGRSFQKGQRGTQRGYTRAMSNKDLTEPASQ